MTEPDDPMNTPLNDSLNAPLNGEDRSQSVPCEPEETEFDSSEENNPDDELLSALLDGELSEQEQAEVNRRLREDPAFRARYNKLNFANRLVESLSPVPDDSDLRTSTIEYISEIVRKEIEEADKKRFRRSLATFLGMLAVALLAFGTCGWLTARYYAYQRVDSAVPPPGGERQPEGPRPGGKPTYSRRQPMPPWGPYMRNRRSWPHYARYHDMKSVLPQELRGEDLGALDKELLAYGKNIPADDPIRNHPNAKERILYRFISERGVDSFVALLSDRARDYIEPLREDQKIWLIGLLLITGLRDRLDRQSHAGPENWNRHEQRDIPPHAVRPGDTPPGHSIPPRENPPRESIPLEPGFFWKNETTSELAKTLRELPERQREELLQLPDDEMYARLLVLHWGFNPQPPFGREPAMRHSYNWRGKPIDDWNRFVTEETGSRPEGETQAEGDPDADTKAETDTNVDAEAADGAKNNAAEENATAKENAAPEPDTP